MSAASRWKSGYMAVPRPLQQLFDYFPLRVYEANGLPIRTPSASATLATLHVFCSHEDARLGNPSFNPGCLKWQTFLRLSSIPFVIVSSTNHASPSGSLPFLQPPRDSPRARAPDPVPASKLAAYVSGHGNRLSCSSPRLEAFQALLDTSLRHAWIRALYLDANYAPLLETLYIAPCSSSAAVRTTLRRQLRAAAQAEIAAGSVHVVGAARRALDALAALLAESETGWFGGQATPGLFDAAVFAYTHLMLKYMAGDSNGAPGGWVRTAGTGELLKHRWRLLEMIWPEEALRERDGEWEGVEVEHTLN